MIYDLKLLIVIEALLALAVGIFYYSAAGLRKNIVSPRNIFLMLVVPVCGLFLREKYSFYLILAIIPFFSLGDPRKLAGIYLLMLPQFPELRDQLVIGPLYVCDFSAIDAFNLGALLALLTVRQVQRRNLGHVDIACWLLFLVSLGVASRGLLVNAVLRQVIQVFLTVVPPFFILSRTLRTEEDGAEAGMALVLGALCNVVVAIFESFHHWPLYQQFYSSLHVPLPDLSATLSIRAGFQRAQGALGNPATLSLLSGLALITCVALKNRFKPVARWLVMALLVGGMIASQSRGGWIAAAVGLIMYWLYKRQFVSLGLFGGAVMVGWGLISAVLPRTSRIGELVGRSGDAQFTADYRANLLKRGLEEFRTHPISGQTNSQLQISMNDMRQGEHIIDFVNAHLFVALTLGGFGLLVWLIAWAIPAVSAWKARPVRLREHQVPVALPFAMLGVCFTGLAFTSTVDRMIPWTAMSFGLVSAFIAINQNRLAGGGDAAKRPAVWRGPLPNLRSGLKIAPR